MATDSKASRPRAKSSNDVSAPAEELGLELSSDIKGILAALQQVRQKAQKDGQKKNKETIENLASEIKSQTDAKRQKTEKEWQNLVKTATKTCKDVSFSFRKCFVEVQVHADDSSSDASQYEAALQGEFAKYQSAKEKFSKEKASHVQTYEDLFTKFGEERDKLIARFEQQRKKDKASFVELQKFCEEKISASENLLKKNKQEDKSFSILRKSLGSFLSSNSDDELDD